ncbi:MAG: hypothetical protein RID09_01385 [Coleofasciculus sp. G1-WW12-02]|uniref:hypothetical protein n=1 Tax=Coleofasciculus sp. G1-WW12-02 TaxID=3068483 RepID=UPI003304A8EC
METRAELPTGNLNAYGYPDNVYEMTGIELTFFGLFGLLSLLIPAIGWLANPAYWVSCFFFLRQQYNFSMISSLIAIIVGFTGTVSAFWFRLPNGSSPFSELALDKLLAGFWLWLAAPGFIAFISIIKLINSLLVKGK